MKIRRLLRTVRHLRASQIAAQLGQLRRRSPAPVSVRGSAALPIVAVEDVRVPFLPAPAHARWNGALHFDLVGCAHRFPQSVDWDHAEAGPLWSYHLHQFDYARAPELAPTARSELLLDWVRRHPKGAGWNPHPISLRVLSWGKLLLTPGALDLSSGEREQICESLALQLDTLHARPEIRIQGNHLFSNYLGLVFGSLLFAGPRAEPWRARMLDLERELSRQIGADGLHEERSPMYHALLLENVLDLLNVARSRDDVPAEFRERLAACAGRMLGALNVVTHPDGEIALFGDSAFGVAHPPEVLGRYAEALGVEPARAEASGVLREGGYVRLEGGNLTAIVSVAGPSPAHQPGHAHCDALSFELSVGSERVITDTGVFEYLPGRRREWSRATQAHATLEVAGVEQAEIWSGHRVGGRPRVRVRSQDPLHAVEAECRGWRTPRTVHVRRFEMDEAGLAIEDRLEGRARPVRLQLPLAPGLEPRLESHERVRVPLASGRDLLIELPEVAGEGWHVEYVACFPEFGRQETRAMMVAEGRLGRAGVWRFGIDNAEEAQTD